jgi:hypothetical protein
VSQSEPVPDAASRGEATEAGGEITAEVVLNAAVAFAGHVASAATQAAAKGGESVDPALRDAVMRQYLLETATLCLRRLGESYAAAAAAADTSELAALLGDGAERAGRASAAVEALGDLGLDLLDRLLG